MAEHSNSNTGDSPGEPGQARRGPMRALWENLPLPAKVAAVLVVVGATLGFGWIIGGNQSGAWKPVSNNLTGEDLRAASSSLEAKGIPYKVEAGTLFVDESYIHDARLELAASTMPSGRTVGFELFDESELGRSAFAEKINFHRALEGELARTIGSIAPIASARVHLVMPDDKLFRDQDVDPSASVHVSLKPGEGLSPKQVSAIRHLVAGAVEKLAPGQVTIVDESGALIGGPRDPELEAADGVFEHQRKYEHQLEGKIIDLLEPVVGVGGVKVKVNARIDYSHVVETEDRVNPDEQAVVSEQNREEQRTAADSPAVGIPGMGSNTPDRNPPAAGTAGQALANKSETTTNFQSSRSSKRVDSPRGRTEQLSVAVIVDNARDVAADGSTVVVPRTQEELVRYEALVTRAVGIDESRGDTLEVVADTILRPNESQSTTSGEAPAEPFPWKLWAAAAGALLVIALGMYLLLRSRKTVKNRVVELERERELLLEAANAPPVITEPLRPTATEQVEVLRIRALTSGHEDMRRVATVFRTWLSEEPVRKMGA